MSISLIWLTGMLLLAGEAAAPARANPELAALTQEGVRLQNGDYVRLPEPTMAIDLAAEQQADVLREVADKYPLDRFLRESIVAPFVLEITSIDNPDGKRTGQRVDFYFVAYGDLDALASEDLFRDLAGAEDEGGDEAIEARELTDEEMQTRGLESREADGLVESYVWIDTIILERVRLQGVGRTVREKTDEAMLATWMLDERFRDDEQLPSRWRPIERDAAGRDVLGEPTPYSGAGGYIRVTKLQSPAGALFVECHAAFDEPHGWFDGRNLLRSKLPLVVQDNVRSFRRKLAKATAEAASQGDSR